jgi:hypothetical protein
MLAMSLGSTISAIFVVPSCEKINHKGICKSEITEMKIPFIKPSEHRSLTSEKDRRDPIRTSVCFHTLFFSQKTLA